MVVEHLIPMQDSPEAWMHWRLDPEQLSWAQLKSRSLCCCRVSQTMLMIFLKWIYFKGSWFIRRSWKLWLEENSRWPIQSSQEALEGNVVSRGGWLSLKEDRQDQWLQNQWGPSLPKEVIHFTKNVPRQPQRQAPKKKKGPGEPPVGSQRCHAPTQNAHKSGQLWGNFMGALVSAPSLPGDQVGVTAPVGTPPIPPHVPASLPWASCSL